MNEDDVRLTPREGEELVASVLRRTSGSACGRAEELLCDYADLRLRHDDRALVEAHLAHCGACGELARNLGRASALLPSFASIDPGPAFTMSVLAATSRARPDSLGERLASRWRQWLARPRLAFEAAYAATLVLVLVAGNPAGRLLAASERTASVASAGIERAKAALPSAVARVAPAAGLPDGVRTLGGIRSAVVERQTEVGGGLAGAWDRAMRQWSSAWGWLQGTAVDLMKRVTSAWTSLRTVVAGWTKRGPSERSRPASSGGQSG